MAPLVPRKPAPRRSLATRFPKLAAQWDMGRNDALTPRDVTAGSGSRVWWKCPKGPDHRWQATVLHRSEGQGCPFCRGLKVSVTNNLAQRFPAVSQQWHHRRNGTMGPDDVVAGSHRRVWWKCPKGPDHEWQSPVVGRTRGAGCPFCRGTWVSRSTSLAARFPTIALQWHPTKNKDLHPTDVVAGSDRKIWWKCPQGDDHVWRTSAAQRTSTGYGCPFCSGRYPSTSNNLARNLPHVARFWHPTKNGRLRPTDVLPGSPRVVWWRCDKGPDHEWRTSVASAKKMKGCLFCNNLRVSITNCLATTHPHVAARWHRRRNRGLTPRQIMRWSKAKVWWKCPRGPDHEWGAIVAAMVGTSASCPFCRNRRVSVTNSLAALYPKIARELSRSRNRDLTSADVLAAANDLVWWRCPLGHEWRASVRDRTLGGRACPLCAEGTLRKRATI